MSSVNIACSEMFRRHRVEAFGGSFHVPAAREYSCLFAWDSGYHALALRHIDRASALEELRTLYTASTMEDGLLAHERPLPGSDERTKIVTSWFGPIYRPDGRSFLIDPPVAAYAGATLAENVTDIALLDAAESHLNAIERLRTLSPGGLPIILHPLESGADASPLFDSFVDVSSRRAFLSAHRALIETLEPIGWNAAGAVRDRHPFVFSDPIFCGWHLLALEALADAWRRLGRAERGARLDERAAALGAVMLRDMWSAELSLFVGYDHLARRQTNVPTLGGIVAAGSRIMREAGIAERVIGTHLDPTSSRFWGRMGISFNPLDGRAIGPKSLLWRGDVVWGATQYWSHLVLARKGELERARLAREQMQSLIEREGFREYYDANTGKGLGAGEIDGFTWPALVLEMAAEEVATETIAKP